MKKIICNLLILFCSLTCSHSTYAFISTKDIEREFNSCISGGCDPVTEINRKVDDGIESKGRALGKGLRVEVAKLVKQIFDEQLRPFARELSTLIDDKIITTEDAAKRLLDRADKTIILAVTEASKAGTTLTQDIRNNIIVESGKIIKESLDSLAYNLDCIPAKREIQLSRFLKDSLACKVSDYFCKKTKCHADLGIEAKPLSDYGMTQGYLLLNCFAERSINENMPATLIRAIYGDIQISASKCMCEASLAGESEVSKQVCYEKYQEAAKKAAIWRWASSLE